MTSTSSISSCRGMPYLPTTSTRSATISLPKACDRTTGVVLRGTESLLTHRWRVLDSNYRSPKGEPLRGSKPANRQQATVSKRHPSDGGPIVRIQYPPAASHTYPSATSGFLRMTQSTRLSHSGPDWHRPDSAESGHPRALDAGCVISDELSPGPTAYLGSRPLFAYRGWQDPSCVTRPRRLLTVLIVFRSQTVLPVVMPTTVSPHSGVIVMAMVVVGIVAPMVIVYGFSLYLVDIWLWATTATA